jgi:hypothetical protein
MGVLLHQHPAAALHCEGLAVWARYKPESLRVGTSGSYALLVTQTQETLPYLVKRHLAT